MYTLSRWHTKLAGKATLYMLNAYVDAYLANSLARYVTSDHQEDNQRVKEYIELCEHDADAHVLGISYDLYYMNGLYDYMYAFVFINLLPKDIREKFSADLKKRLTQFAKKLGYEDAYTEYGWGYINLFQPIWQLLQGKIWDLKGFRKKFNLTEDQIPTHKEFIQGIIEVQKKNINNNMRLGKQILKGENPRRSKIDALLAFSNEFDKPQTFIKSAAKTLVSASRWDILFTALIKTRFPRRAQITARKFRPLINN